MSFNFDSSDFEKKLDDLSKNVDQISGTNSYSFEEIFPPQFMSQHTNADSIEDFLDTSPFEIETQEDFDTLPEKELDKYVAQNTSFSTWEDMLSVASKEMFARKLGF